MFKSILVPTDFSEPSLAAVDLAARLAELHGSRLTLLSIAELLYAYRSDEGLVAQGHPGFEELHERSLELARSRVTDLARPLGADAVVREGYAPEQILQQVAEGEHDLVVMGTHGRTGMDLAMLGSVTERVLRACPVPVLVGH
jgi:nucleotide-binding universal stress UspA family protein